MITVNPTIDEQILESELADKYRRTMDWYSAAVFWKRELSFIQNLIEKYAPTLTSVNDKKKLGHFQNLIIYYNGEVIDRFIARLHDHGKGLRNWGSSEDIKKNELLDEHEELMSEVETFNSNFKDYKEEVFEFVEGENRL